MLVLHQGTPEEENKYNVHMCTKRCVRRNWFTFVETWEFKYLMDETSRLKTVLDHQDRDNIIASFIKGPKKEM